MLVTFGETSLQFTPRGHERLARARETRVQAAGIESSAAVAANALGGESTWVSTLPDSPLGRQVVGQLREHGIDTAVTWTDPREARQGIVFRESGSPPRTDEVWYDRGNAAIASASPGDFPMDRIQGADVLFTGASTPALSEQAATTTAAVFRAAHGSGVTTALDVDYQPGFRSPERYREVVFDLVDHIDVLVTNEDHLEAVFDRSGKPRELANTIAAERDVETVVITRGGHGALALHDGPGTNVVHEREAVETAPVDAAGQHAAFSGGFLQRVVEGGDLAEALSYGVGTATFARSVPGPLLTADREEIERVVDSVREAGR